MTTDQEQKWREIIKLIKEIQLDTLEEIKHIGKELGVDLESK